MGVCLPVFGTVGGHLANLPGLAGSNPLVLQRRPSAASYSFILRPPDGLARLRVAMDALLNVARRLSSFHHYLLQLESLQHCSR